MIKNILTILIIFCFSNVNAQYEWTPAKVILKDGTSFRGLVKFPMHSGGLISMGSTKFKYKKNRKSSIEKFGSETLDKVIFGDEQFATIEYQYVPIKKNKNVLMELIINGKVNLYYRVVSQYSTTNSGDQNFQSIPTATIPTTTSIDYNNQYFLLRENEKTATLIIDPNSFQSFNYKAKKYFSDCKDIVSFIESKLYQPKYLLELVEDYNLLCE